MREEVEHLRAENERLWNAVDMLWGWMGAEEVRALRENDPELAELARHAHHRMSHEQRMMRR